MLTHVIPTLSQHARRQGPYQRLYPIVLDEDQDPGYSASFVPTRLHSHAHVFVRHRLCSNLDPGFVYDGILYLVLLCVDRRLGTAARLVDQRCAGIACSHTSASWGEALAEHVQETRQPVVNKFREVTRESVNELKEDTYQWYTEFANPDRCKSHTLTKSITGLSDKQR